VSAFLHQSTFNSIFETLKSSSSILCLSEKQKIILSVDETSGGGLMEGYNWVNSFTSVISVLSVVSNHFKEVKKEWSVDVCNESTDFVVKAHLKLVETSVTRDCDSGK